MYKKFSFFLASIKTKATDIKNTLVLMLTLKKEKFQISHSFIIDQSMDRKLTKLVFYKDFHDFFRPLRTEIEIFYFLNNF